MKIRSILATFLLVLAAAASSAGAVERSGPTQAKALLDQAVAQMKRDGAPAALKSFNDTKGAFVQGDLYVFAFDLDGKYLASGANPKLVGTLVKDQTDAAGKPLFADMIQVAKSKGEGEVDYVWLNRQTNKVESKRSFIRRVGDVIVGVGYYR